MSSKIMINCVSSVPPARSTGTDTQLVLNQGGLILLLVIFTT